MADSRVDAVVNRSSSERGRSFRGGGGRGEAGGGDLPPRPARVVAGRRGEFFFGERRMPAIRPPREARRRQLQCGPWARRWLGVDARVRAHRPEPPPLPFSPPETRHAPPWPPAFQVSARVLEPSKTLETFEERVGSEGSRRRRRQRRTGGAAPRGTPSARPRPRGPPRGRPRTSARRRRAAEWARWRRRRRRGWGWGGGGGTRRRAGGSSLGSPGASTPPPPAAPSPCSRRPWCVVPARTADRPERD